VSHINEKLGIRPAGTRAMMKLPKDRAIRNAVTSAQCPACQRWGARLSAVRGHDLDVWCTTPKCGQRWTVTIG